MVQRRNGLTGRVKYRSQPVFRRTGRRRARLTVTHLDPFVERVVERGLRTLRGAPVPAPAGHAAFIAADDFTGGGVLDVGAVAAGPKVLAGRRDCQAQWASEPVSVVGLHRSARRGIR